MNQKDYGAIAEIINKHFVCGFIGDGTVHGSGCRKCKVVNDLADYFEKEDTAEYGEHLDYPGFNREQFLKDCGVE